MTMTNPTFSIIVPVYGVEALLPVCVDSVLSQDFRDLELILVDDGSPDGCPRICDKYASKDTRVHVTHKDNGGVSDARNAGINVSHGEYILFLDGDDCLVDQCLRRAYDTLMASGKPDLIVGNYVSHFADGRVVPSAFHLTPMDGTVNDYAELLIRELNQNHEIPWMICSHAYKASVVRSNNVRFDEQLCAGEDCAFFMEYVRHVRTYACMAHPLSNYRRNRQGSITASTTRRTLTSQLIVSIRYFDEYAAKKSCDSIRDFFARRFASDVWTMSELKAQDDIRAVEQLVTSRHDILEFANGSQWICCKIAWKTLGYYRGSQAMHALAPQPIRRFVKKLLRLT